MMSFVFKRRLKSIKDTYVDVINSPDYGPLIDELMQKLSACKYDDKVANFAVDKVARISTELEQNQGNIENLKTLLNFLDLLEGKTYDQITKEYSFKSLQTLYFDFEKTGLKNDAKETNTVKVPEALVYLKKIASIDEINRDYKNKIFVNDLAEKLETVIHVCSSFLYSWYEFGKQATTESSLYEDINNEINKILEWVSGSETKLLTRGIYLLTQELSELNDDIITLEKKLENLEFKYNNPNFSRNGKFTFEEYEAQKNELNALIASKKKDLSLVLRSLKNEEVYSNLNNLFVKLNKHIDNNIIGPLNQLISKICKLFRKDHRFLLVSDEVKNLALKHNIRIESILKECEASSFEMEKFYDVNVKATGVISNYINEIKKLLLNRKDEELLIAKSGIINKIYDYFDKYEKNGDINLCKTGTLNKKGQGILSVKCMFYNYEFASLDGILKCIDKFNRTISIKKMNPYTVKELNDAIKDLHFDRIFYEVTEDFTFATKIQQYKTGDISELTVKELKTIIDKKLVGKSYFPHIKTLMKQFPLNKSNYESPELISLADELEAHFNNFKLVQKVKELTLQIASELEEIHPSISIEFSTINIRKPTMFSSKLDEWLENNEGILNYSGEDHFKIKEKISKIKTLLVELEDYAALLPKY